MGLIAARSADHVGLTVPDLDEAVALFRDVFGFEQLYRHAPQHSSDPEVQVRQFGRHPDTRIVGIAMLRLGELKLELFEFSAPDQRQDPPRSSDWGGAHLAFYVDDLDAAVTTMRAREGVEVLGDPIAMPGPEAGEGNRFIYARALRGITFELLSYPSGKAYER